MTELGQITTSLTLSQYDYFELLEAKQQMKFAKRELETAQKVYVNACCRYKLAELRLPKPICNPK